MHQNKIILKIKFSNLAKNVPYYASIVQLCVILESHIHRTAALGQEPSQSSRIDLMDGHSVYTQNNSDIKIIVIFTLKMIWSMITPSFWASSRTSSITTLIAQNTNLLSFTLFNNPYISVFWSKITCKQKWADVRFCGSCNCHHHSELSPLRLPQTDKPEMIYEKKKNKINI